MASISFRLRSKANKHVSIKVRVILGRGRQDLELNTGFSINPKDWSETTNRPKQNNTENKVIFNNLKKLESFLFESINTDMGESVVIDTSWLDAKINECFKRVIKDETGLLVNHIQHIIDNANTRKVKNKIGLSASTIKNYTLFRNIILEYQKKIKKQILFIEITKPFVDKFTNWLVNTKNYSTNYSGKQLEILKTVCIDAEKNEIQVAPYSKVIPHFRESEKDRYIQTLSFDELELIKNIDLSNNEQLKQFKKENPELTKNLSITPENLNNVRNWILLGCEIGQRGGDLLEITHNNIRYNGTNYYIDITQQKTNKNVTIGVRDLHIIDIIENNLPKKIPHQKLNEYAKVICKLAKIVEVVKGTKLNAETNRKEFGNYPKYELIASHCFRRSFASNYYKIVPTAILMNLTGHSKESTFLTYINKREDKDANADLFLKYQELIDKDKKPQLKVIKDGTND